MSILTHPVYNFMETDYDDPNKRKHSTTTMDNSFMKTKRFESGIIPKFKFKKRILWQMSKISLILSMIKRCKDKTEIQIILLSDRI